MLEARPGLIDISVPGIGGKGKRDGIRLHRSRALTRDLVMRRRGIPVTTPARTIIDLQGAVPAEEYRRAVRQADVLGLPLGGTVQRDPTRSKLERLFLRLCREQGLPAPDVNVTIGSLEVDFLWRDRRLVVETDGYKYHRGRAAFEDDRDRDLRLRELGYGVVRLTYQQVINEPARVADLLAKVLRADPASQGYA
jgi:very-short-patch-repair endonuclease